MSTDHTALREAEKRATPGPWWPVLFNDDSACIMQEHTGITDHSDDDKGECRHDDASFIALARAALPGLLDEIEELQAQLTASQSALAVSLRAERETLDVLRAYAAHTHLSHCGSCCLCAPGGGVIVTEESCVCHPEDKAVLRLFGMFDEQDRARATSADLAQGKAGHDDR